MPTTYTHDIFGKEVFKKLPEPLKDTVRKGKDLYRIGLHGPDILFYYRPLKKNKVTELGSKLHHELAKGFFEKGIAAFRAEPSAELAAYLLGFCCHYMLDSTCHGYINRYVKTSGISHAEIETEFDRQLMIRDEKKLFSYCPASVLEPTKENCKIIAKVFPQLTVKQVYKSILWQKRFDRLLTCKGIVKEKIILTAMKGLGCYESMQGQVMRKQPNPACDVTNKRLQELYQKALQDTPKIMENLYTCLYGNGTLSERFLRDYE